MTRQRTCEMCREPIAEGEEFDAVGEYALCADREACTDRMVTRYVQDRAAAEAAEGEEDSAPAVAADPGEVGQAPAAGADPQGERRSDE